MLSTLIIFSILFWLVPLMQAAVAPWWAGDWILLLTFFWGFYFLRKIEREGRKKDLWSFFLPFAIGTGMASFLFHSWLFYSPYFLFVGILAYLVFLKGKWAGRPREGTLYVFLAVVSFFFFQGIIRTFLIKSVLDYQFLVKALISSIFCWLIWAGFFYTERKEKEKIR